MSDRPYYIIEHPTKGVLRDVEMKGEVPIPRYSRTMRRNNLKVLRIQHLHDALKMAEELENNDPKCKRLDVRKSPTWLIRCPTCKAWITMKSNQEYGHKLNCPDKGVM